MFEFKNLVVDSFGKAGKKVILKLDIKDHTIEIYDALPDYETLYFIANFFEIFDPKFSENIISKIINSNNLDDVLNSMKKVWDLDDILYDENNFEIEFSNNTFYFPIYSKTAGRLGTIILKGNLSSEFILNFLAISDAITSILEGFILKMRVSELLYSTLEALSKALTKKINVDEKLQKEIENKIIAIGEKFNIPKDILKIASKIYDLGKIGVPDYVFSKKELSKEDLEILNKHVEYGYEILSKIEDIPEQILKAVLYHHEKKDGSGPLKVKDVPLLAQIIGIVLEVVENKTPIDALKGKYDEKLIEEMKKNG